MVVKKTAIPNQKLSWLGHFLFTGLFDGAHKFELIDNHNGSTTFIQSEQFSGILVAFFFFKKKILNGEKIKIKNLILKPSQNMVESLF